MSGTISFGGGTTQADAPPTRMRRRAFAAIQGLATVTLLVLLFRGFDWPAFRAVYARLPLWYYLGSLAVVLTGLVLYAWRWHILLIATGTRVPFHVVLQQYVIGVFLNNFFPSTVGGDAAKVFYLGRAHGYRAITASVVLDRVLGVGLLAVLATVALWAEPIRDPRYHAVRIALSGITGLFAAVIVLALVGTGGLPKRLARFGDRAVAIATHLQQFRTDLARAVRLPHVWAHSAATVTGYFVLLTLVYQEFILLHAGLRPGFVPVLMAIASLAVLSNVPIAINGIGLREQLHVLLLEPLGVPKEMAVAISLLLFGHLLVASLAGGFLWWRASRERGTIA